MLRVLLFLVPLALAIYALVDCISSKDEDVRHLPKLVWILLIVLAWLIGPLAWIFVGRRRSVPRLGGAGRRGGGGWVAPDDNPEFLRSLDEGRPRPRGDGKDADPKAAPDDKGLPENWEEDLRRREDELRQRDGDEENPPGGKDR
ncbi:PLD nuclease N-terminal domain-containing protein [Streptomyces marincola]|uniref:Cardiolipin synthase N-terminal domain-containing protein n=1 Tax=Streptomyces marincola TaxID=2878388 RepID=A0A1W7CX93_9ACTN|nr:PLD nuclease N-terminal domain-containing protein [Streptomyces marincola]ARQ69356.1 hypothetical protein CAG99_11160 [Streptomyces marincola]